MRPGGSKAPRPHAFVLGATGYVGRHVVRCLAADGHTGARTLAHVRPGSGRADALVPEFESLPRVEVSRAPLEEAPLADALRAFGATHVFLCHGTTSGRAKDEGIEDPYVQVDLGLTTLALDAAAGLEPPPRIVHLSSVGADSRSRSAYLRARGRAEDAIRASGLPFTICRAPLITGPDRDEGRPAERVGAVLLDPALRLLGAVGFGRLRDRYSSMEGSEAAEGLVRTGFHYMTIGRVVQSDELRREGVYERERWTPASRRDAGRH